MKKLLLFSILFFACIQSFAQFEKGKLYPGLSVGARFHRYYTYTVKPDFSIGLGKHSTAGVFFDYTTNKGFRYNEGVAPGYMNTYTVGLSYNYYHFFGKSKKWGWFINGSLAYSRSIAYEKNATPQRTTFHETSLTLTPGIFFKASPRVLFHLDFGGVGLYKPHSYPFQAKSNFGTQVNLGVTIGLGKMGRRKK